MRRKLNLGFLAIILLIWALSVCTVLNTMSVREVLFELKEDIIPGAIAMSKMKYEAAEIRQWTLTYIIRGNVIRREETIKDWLRKEYAALEKDAKIHLGYERHTGLEDQQRATDEIVDLSQKLISVSAEIIDLKDKGAGNDELFEKVRKEFGPVFYPLRTVLDEHVAIHLEELSAAQIKVHDKHDAHIKYIIIFGLVTTLLAVFIGLLVDRLFMRYIAERKQADEALKESEEQKKAILDASVDRIRLVDKDLRILWANKTTTKELGLAPEQIVGKTCYEVLVGRDTPCPECPAIKSLKTGHIEHAVRHSTKSKTIKGEVYWDGYAVPIKRESSDVVNIIQITRNITEQMKAEEELRKEKDKLQDALSKVKALSGLLPICSNCKKIRDDKGYWNQIESYIHDHSEADFSHSICPECAKELYPDFYKGD